MKLNRSRGNGMQLLQEDPVKTKTSPSVDRRKDVSDYYTRVYSDPRVENKVSQYFFPNQTINTVAEVLGQVSPAARDFVQGFQDSGTYSGLAANYGFDGASNEVLDANMSNPVDRYEMYMDLNRNPLVATSTGGDVTRERDREGNHGYIRNYGRGTMPGNVGKPLIMGLGRAQVMGEDDFQVDHRLNESDERSTTAHEMSHSTDKGGLLMPKPEVDFIESLQGPMMWQFKLAEYKPEDREGKKEDIKRFAKYVSKPTEVKARLMDLRYIADQHDLDSVELNSRDLRELASNLGTSPEGDRIRNVMDQLSYLYDDDAISSLLENVW